MIKHEHEDVNTQKTKLNKYKKAASKSISPLHSNFNDHKLCISIIFTELQSRRHWIMKFCVIYAYDHQFRFFANNKQSGIDGTDHNYVICMMFSYQLKFLTTFEHLGKLGVVFRIKNDLPT